jgi:hypothetical protein
MNNNSDQSSNASPTPAAAHRGKIADKIHKCRVLLDRFLKNNLDQGIPLSETNIKKLAYIIRCCSTQGQEARPWIEHWRMAKVFKRVLRASQILPDDIPPQIQMLLEAWSHNEYNFVSRPPRLSESSEVESAGYDGSEDEVDDKNYIPATASAMRGIIVTCGNAGQRSYILDKHAQRPFNVFGHNNLKVGQWWPLQICALRDGAHGARMGGISGRKDDGAYSVVISGGGSNTYEDRDLGDTVWYTGSGGHGADQPVTNVNQALMTSCNTRRPVRVIRTAKADSDFAPSSGLRYDGLYDVVHYEQRPNRDGNLVWKFKLQRRSHQDSIRRDVPTEVDLRTMIS